MRFLCINGTYKALCTITISFFTWCSNVMSKLPVRGGWLIPVLINGPKREHSVTYWERLKGWKILDFLHRCRSHTAQTKFTVRFKKFINVTISCFKLGFKRTYSKVKCFSSLIFTEFCKRPTLTTGKAGLFPFQILFNFNFYFLQSMNIFPFACRRSFSPLSKILPSNYQI